ncbi:MAG TPA: 3-hydroxyacyl-CoA dehydrogenase NAD-binding domain-containing protein [Vicinamibacterales bacterium]|nr:3-hydroxyacyl-CoA dehydrogenase NAD-binding domain-containing protein [Vicinamibacterales bacterium]
MNPAVTLTRADDVALIRIDNPPVNALSPDVIDGLGAALEAAGRDAAVRAIVVIGAGRTFIAGADIKGLEGMAWGSDSGAPEMHDLLQRIEDFPKPVVMAMHGTALGGGLEVAMAGHYRVAVPDGQMGQPEVNLGIIPGAEGTQRLPRLVGLEKAIEMCVSGKPIKAKDALSAGLIDRVIDGDLATGATAFAREMAARGSSHPRTRERRDTLPAAEAVPALLAAGKEMARKTRRHMEAPLAVVDALEAAATLPFAEGCAREREIFFQCSRSEQCKALIHAFFADRGVARVPGVSKDTPAATVTRVGIVGAGTMGGGIAMACANAGIHVRLTDAAAAGLDQGMATIRKNYDVSVKRGRFTPESVEQRLSLIQPQVGYDGFGEVDLIIEAVFENLALKKQIAAALDRVAKPGCVIATNTSTLDIDEIASATSRPSQVLGLHFFSPANVMRLVEIVRGKATSPETLATAMALAKRLGKVGVVVGNCAGFVGNRMMFPYMYEAQFLVEEGATPEQVDRALTDFGMAMGMFAVDDMAGLDVAWRVRQELGQFSAPGVRKPLVADTLCEMGRFGQKTGKGWYTYGDDRKPVPDPEVLALIEQAATRAGIKRRTFTSAEIIERTIYALINEGARVLDEGFVSRAADIDVIYVNGYGFPAWRGGPMFYADRVGLARLYERVSAFHREHGERWAPAPLLERLAKEGMTFRELDKSRAIQEPAAARA